MGDAGWKTLGDLHSFHSGTILQGLDLTAPIRCGFSSASLVLVAWCVEKVQSHKDLSHSRITCNFFKKHTSLLDLGFASWGLSKSFFSAVPLSPGEWLWKGRQCSLSDLLVLPGPAPGQLLHILPASLWTTSPLTLYTPGSFTLYIPVTFFYAAAINMILHGSDCLLRVWSFPPDWVFPWNRNSFPSVCPDNSAQGLALKRSSIWNCWMN